MPSITPATLHAVAAGLGLEIDRFETTRPADADSIGNGNWLGWSGEERASSSGATTCSAPKTLAYEAQVLHHLTDRGWSVPTPVAGPVRYDDRLWAATRYVPGRPHQSETPAQVGERGSLLARLHADLKHLNPGQRSWFYQGCDAMGAFQDWDPCVAALQEIRPELADWAGAAMADAKGAVAKDNLFDLPQTMVHGDFATWNLHFEGARLAGVIDFDLTHQDSRRGSS